MHFLSKLEVKDNFSVLFQVFQVAYCYGAQWLHLKDLMNALAETL